MGELLKEISTNSNLMWKAESLVSLENPTVLNEHYPIKDAIQVTPDRNKA